MYIKCWDCGQELYAFSQEDLNREFDRGYLQAIRDIKDAKIYKGPCATTLRKIEGYADS